MPDLIGNAHINQYIQKLENLPPTFLFSGPDGVGKSRFAQQLVQKHMNRKLAQHPDIHEIRPEGRLGVHSVDAIRRFITEVHLPPYEADYKFFIVHDAHAMLPVSANALLKTLEEPCDDTVIILLSHKPELLLPTIISRCRTLTFLPIPKLELKTFLETEYKLSSESAEIYAQQSRGSIGRAISLIKGHDSPKRGLILKILSQGLFKSYLSLHEASSELSSLIEKEVADKEKLLRQEWTSSIKGELTEYQKGQLDKEVLGTIMTCTLEEVSLVFDLFLSWYRDMTLLLYSGNEALIMNREYLTELKQTLKLFPPPSLDAVQVAVNEAFHSIKCSTKLNTALEAFFLKLSALTPS